MWSGKYDSELNKRRTAAYAAGGQMRVDRQHASGKLTARERIHYLLDEGSFNEIGTLIEARVDEFSPRGKRIPGDGVVTGFGKIDGQLVYISSQDFTVNGGTLGEYHAKKICNVMDMALKAKAPFISINDSGGARIEEGISALDGYSRIFFRHVKASGVIPQIAAIMGPCAGGACYAPALCDFIFMTEKTGRMFITGPEVIKAVTGEKISAEELGGANVHMEQSGVAHFVYASDKECLDGIKKLLGYLKKSEADARPVEEDRKNDSYILQNLVPENGSVGYDMHFVIKRLLDKEDFLEVQERFGKSIIVGFGRMDGRVRGIVASQPSYLAGALDIDASEKAARFVRCCDCFDIPILTLVDVPGFLPGTGQEREGIIRRGAKLLYAYAEAAVPKISLILRKAYGGAYIALNSKGLGADIVYAWPIAQIAVMGAEGAVDIILKKEVNKSEEKEENRKKKIVEYNERFMSPYIAAEKGYIDDVISVNETREKLIKAFESLENENAKKLDLRHGNIPL